MTLAGRRRHAQARSMLGDATHHGKFYGDGNLHGSETVSGFRRGVVRATILHRRNSRIRFSHGRERFINRGCGS
jgi:IS5 family transposase